MCGFIQPAKTRQCESHSWRTNRAVRIRGLNTAVIFRKPIDSPVVEVSPTGGSGPLLEVVVHAAQHLKWAKDAAK